MKTSFLNIRRGSLLLLPFLFAALAPAWAGNAPSKGTADYYLVNPKAYEGTEITLDVALVKPVHFDARIPGIQFFHAFTFDQRNHAAGGGILVAVPESENAKFAKKYGTQFEGRPLLRTTKTTKLKGTLLAANAAGPAGPRIKRKMGELQATAEKPVDRGMARKGGAIWLVDYEGKCAELIKTYKEQHKKEVLELPADAGDAQPADGTATGQGNPQ